MKGEGDSRDSTFPFGFECEQIEYSDKKNENNNLSDDFLF